jgi:hypothetical protein
MEVPPALRTWFLVHAAVDWIVGLPLLVAPVTVLSRLGWTCVDPAATRLVAAALLGIGGASFLVRDAGVDAYRPLLSLKVIWSFAACAGLLASIGDGSPPAAWAFLCTFIVFAGVWLHHAIRLRQMSRAAALDDAPPAADDDAPDA